MARAAAGEERPKIERPEDSATDSARHPRGEKRRTELLEAVIRLIARSGIAAVTHRAVAAEAGATHRLTTYYFRTKENMVDEAFRHLAAQSVTLTRAVGKDLSAAQDQESAMETAIDAVVDAVRGGLHAADGGVAAELSLVLEISRQPSLARDYAAWQDELEAILAEHSKTFDSDDPRRDARIILAALRGLQIECLGRPDRLLDRAEIRSLVARLLKRL